MAISLKHAFTSAKADGPDSSEVQPSNWNAEHTLTMATARLLGRTTAGTGAAEEISVGAGLTLSGGVLNTAAVASPFVTGMIMIWSGAIGTIPSGWALCNGTNGTPDLRDRFVVGAGSTYAVAAVGGVNTVALSSNEIPSHAHSFSGSTSGAGDHAHGAWTDTQGAHTHGTNIASNTSNNNTIGSYAGGSGNVEINTDSAGAHGHNIGMNNSGNHAHNFSGNTGNAGAGAAHENRPPYYALCYIMKL